MGRPREHDARVAAALLDVAEQLLAGGGPDAVTVRGVADGANVTTRAVYSLFGAKGGLLEALAGRGYDLLSELVSGLPETDDTAADLVEAGVLGFRRFAVERPHLFRLTFERITAEMVRLPVVVEGAQRSYDALLRWIRRAQAAGVLDGRSEVEVAFAFHSLCLGLATSELSRERPPIGAGFWRPARAIDGAHLWRRALTALVDGMRPH